MPRLSASGLPLRTRPMEQGQAGAWEGSPCRRFFPQGWPCHQGQGRGGPLPCSLSSLRVGWQKRPAFKDKQQARGRVAEATSLQGREAGQGEGGRRGLLPRTSSGPGGGWQKQGARRRRPPVSGPPHARPPCCAGPASISCRLVGAHVVSDW